MSFVCTSRQFLKSVSPTALSLDLWNVLEIVAHMHSSAQGYFDAFYIIWFVAAKLIWKYFIIVDILKLLPQNDKSRH